MGDNNLQIEDKDRADPKSVYNQSMKSSQAWYNLDTRGANNEATITWRSPSGQTRTMVMDPGTVSPSIPTEMGARNLQSAQKSATKDEYQRLREYTLLGASGAVTQNTNLVEMYNWGPQAQPYKVNDKYSVRVTQAGIDKVGGKQNVYTIMVERGGKLVPTAVKSTNLNDIRMAFGMEVIKAQTTPDR
jgi:hypothetical protein